MKRGTSPNFGKFAKKETRKNYVQTPTIGTSEGKREGTEALYYRFNSQQTFYWEKKKIGVIHRVERRPECKRVKKKTLRSHEYL